MLHVLHSKSDLAYAQELFQKKFEPYINAEIDVVIGFQGDSRHETVYWSDALGIWICFGAAENRYWNAFGTQKPKPGANLSITCEINIPHEGIDRRIGGVFARESSTGHLYLMHRGIIGGGKKGVGKRLFQRMYVGECEFVHDGYLGDKEVISKLALIAAFSSPRFAQQVTQFVYNVRKMKDFVSGTSFSKNGEQQTEALHGSFNPEFSGTKQAYTVGEIMQAECDHGIIVNSLAESLQNFGLQVSNDKHRDLYVLSEDHSMLAVFEIKTDASTSSVYKAVGQLLLNKVDVPGSPALFMVIPDCAEGLQNQLAKLGIHVITYSWKDNNVSFDGIDTIKELLIRKL